MDGMVFEWTPGQNEGVWNKRAPRENLSPEFGFSNEGLRISADGGRNFGWFEAEAPVECGAHYRFIAEFSVSGIDNINVNVMNLLYWTNTREPERIGAHDAILSYEADGAGAFYTGSQVIKPAPASDRVFIQLGARYLSGGSVTWRRVALEKVEKPVRKPVRIAAAAWNPSAAQDMETLEKELASLVDEAGGLKADLFLLPEFANVCGYGSNEIPTEPVPEGRVCGFLSRKAAEHNMNICAGIMERDGEYLYNAAAIFDRAGAFAGKYRKTHPYWPEEIFYGTLPGDDYPVFDLDIGKVGVMICYDSWYAETARLLTLKGAELILFPNAGYEDKILPARCIDNNNYIAVSSMGCASGVMDTVGNFVSSTKRGIAYSDIDLDIRSCCHPNSGGSMNAGAGGRRNNMNSMSDRMYTEICNEIKKTAGRPWKHTWVN